MPQIISTLLFYGFTICVVWAIVQYVNTRFKTLKKELSTTQKLLLEYIDLQREDAAHADDIISDGTKEDFVFLCKHLRESNNINIETTHFEIRTKKEMDLHQQLGDARSEKLYKIKRLLEKKL